MNKILFLFIFLIVTLGTNAQEANKCSYELKGVVLDAETKEALPFVMVSIKGTKKYALTNNDGEFQLDGLCHVSNCLVISCNGYCETTCDANCDIHKEKKNNSVIYMKPDVVALNEVTISETNDIDGTLSVAQDFVDGELLKIDPTQSLANALSSIEGVTFTSTGSNIQLPVIHGLYGNRVLVLNNGFKHGFQNWGSEHAPEIDIASANNVTVIKGASGVRYGPEALGGAIIVEGNPLHFNKSFGAKIGTGYQTNGRGYFANTEVSQGFKNLSYHVGGGYTRIGDRHAPDYSLTNTGKEEKAFNAGVKYKLNDFDVKLYYSFVDQNLGILRASITGNAEDFENAIGADKPDFIRPFSYDINEPNQLIQHHLATAEINWWYSDEEKLTFRVGRQLNQREEYDVRRNSHKPIINLDLTTTDYQLEWNHKKWLQLDGIMGLQFFTQDNDNNPGTDTTPFIPNYNTYRFSGFIIESLTKGKNTFELGIRMDSENNNVRGRDVYKNVFRDDYTFVNVTTSLGYVRKLTDNITYRTNFGTAWRTPNVEELFAFGQHGYKYSFGMLRYYIDENGEYQSDKVTPLSESGVKPEKGFKWINEWHINQKTNDFTVTAYANYIENYVYERPYGALGTVRGPMPGFFFDQSNSLFIGADFTWQKKWSEELDGSFGLSYLWSKNVERDEPLINQPPIRTSYNLKWSIKPFWFFESAYMSVEPSYTFHQFQAPRTLEKDEVVTPETEIFDFMSAPEGYFLLDASFGFKVNQLSANLSVQNVFNTSYRNYLNQFRYFADDMGRNFLFSINYNFNAK
ncbi:TonB-dependent receptor [Flammeovirga aprica]|uniref:TonB-dependent receptor plug domain-containing protein n=1 Tax=Flammeovirga aprica JL-4 TaxID=694437 RepID=A0A7X9P2V5_9BACT|nr:TonB-dependent receptor [Flammeovirga aprica]NME68544.1 TonB-dependent receptor plug domain-containing protein [Flammeovirga aprica JL-4]